jgi:hypothetical protein
VFSLSLSGVNKECFFAGVGFGRAEEWTIGLFWEGRVSCCDDLNF